MTPDPELIVIVPSRGRPAAAAELAQTFEQTCIANTGLVIAIDEDDPAYRHYEAAAQTMVWSTPGPSTMVRTLNEAAKAFAGGTFAIGFMGDDHRPRTYGWDQRYLDALHELGTGIVYGDDLLQHDNIPTQVAMTADIVRALGHMAPPTLTHLFVDNYWRDLGNAVGCLRYLSDVVVEHLHPFAGKAEMDAGYARVNAHSMYSRDSVAYGTYVHNHYLAADVVKVKALHDA